MMKRTIGFYVEHNLTRVYAQTYTIPMDIDKKDAYALINAIGKAAHGMYFKRLVNIMMPDALETYMWLKSMDTYGREVTYKWCISDTAVKWDENDGRWIRKKHEYMPLVMVNDGTYSTPPSYHITRAELIARKL